MRRITTNVLSVLALVTMVGGIAWAESVHLKNNRKPTYTDNTGRPPAEDLTLSASGALAGLGNGDVVIALTASANPTGQCCNPGGECKVPGHNPAPVDLTGVVAIPGSDIKNGNLSFAVETGGPTTPIPGAPDCPNNSWAENITDLVFTRATVTVYQPAVLDCDSSGCAIINPNTGSTATSVFAITCTLSGVDGTLGSSCP
jgi:hypothetical protein